jgi:hypothetical protein
VSISITEDFHHGLLGRAAFAREAPGWEIAIGWGVSAAACAIFALLLPYVNSATRVDMDRVRADEAARRYGRTWLGLWTKDDEAINGLKATTKLKPGHQVELVPRMSLQGSHYVGWIWKSFSLPLTIPASLIFNHLVRKWLNKRLVRTLMKFAQGDDRPGNYVDHVSARPGVAFTQDYEPLPRSVSKAIAERADASGTQSLPEVRVLLYQLALGGLWQRKDEEEKKKLDTLIKSLVHTSYLAIPNIAKIIAEHIRWSSGTSLSAGVERMDQDLVEWYNSQRRTLVKGFDDGAENA